MGIKHKKYKGGIEGLMKRVKTPGTVDIGIIDEGKHGEAEDLTVASIGYKNEYGTETIPERSFFRSTLLEKRKEIITLKKKLLKKVTNGEMKLEKALGVLGEFVADLVSQKIVDIDSPPNSPATIAAKGSSNPLEASGQLKNSITYEVNR